MQISSSSWSTQVTYYDHVYTGSIDGIIIRITMITVWPITKRIFQTFKEIKPNFQMGTATVAMLMFVLFTKDLSE